MLAVAFTQTVLSVALLYEWIYTDHSSGMLQLLRVPATVKQTYASRTLYQMTKVAITFYVTYSALDDVDTCTRMVFRNQAIDRVHPPVMLIKLVLLVIYMPITALVFIVSLMNINRSGSVKEVILSGVGTVFILNMDDVVVQLGGDFFYKNMLKFIKEKNFEYIKKGSNAGGEREGRDSWFGKDEKGQFDGRYRRLLRWPMGVLAALGYFIMFGSFVTSVVIACIYAYSPP